jgi:hypothetical protein
MKQELIAPAAAIAAAILARYQPANSALSDDVIASAFEQAAHALEMGIQRVDQEAARQQMTSARVTGT